MPLDRFVLIIVVVFLGLGALSWLIWIALVGTQVAGWLGFAAAVPTILIGYVILRVILDRVGNKEDDHYDRIDR